jgi:cyanophycinase
MSFTKSAGKLFIVGGAEDKKGECRILKKFVETAGGKNARIVVLTAATDSPAEVGKEYVKVFKNLGTKDVDFVDISERNDAFDEKRIALVNQATGLYFTGGDQLHITSLIGGTPFHDAINQLYKDKIIIGGTSAGAAMMSNTMIISGDSEENPKFGCMEFAPGMDFILGSIVDTHFSQRGRHGRLLTAIAHSPQELGLGIDEDTAMFVNNNHFEVFGSGAVTIFDASEMSYNNTPYVERGEGLALSDVKIHVLPEGLKFDLKLRQVILPEQSKSKTH